MRKILLSLALFFLFAGVALASSGVSIPTSGSGSVTARNRGSVCTSGCTGGGGAGSFVWFDVRNLSRNQFNWDTLLGSALTADQSKLDNGSYTSTIEKQLSKLAATNGCGSISESGGESFSKGTSSDCVLWENYCASSSLSHGANQIVYTQPFQAARKIKACGQITSNFQQWNQIHPFTYDGEIASINTLTGWNLTVWRQDTTAPIFERRIGLTSTSEPSDADPWGLSQQAWWFGGVSKANRTGSGTGGVFSARTLKAGPLGAMPSNGDGAADAQACQSRWDARATTVTENGTKWKNSAASGPTALYRKVAGQWVSTTPGSYLCYWQWGKSSNGSFEAIKISWQVAGGSGTPSGRFSYTLFGQPNKFYAVRVTSMDHREQLLMPTQSDKVAFIYGGNYLRVFAPTFKKSNSCPPSVCKTVITTDMPTLNVDLAADTPVPTRVWSQDTITTSTEGWLTDSQSIFPEVASLKLFTPQMNYNGATGSSYPSAYVLSDTDAGAVSRLLAPFPGPPNPQHPKMLLAPQLLVMPQPMNLPSSDQDFTQLSENTYQLNWLRPTITNPCPERVQNQPPDQGNWPPDPSKCSDGTRNAWDDYLDASVTYEARSIASNSTSKQGFISDQILRCANPDASGNCSTARATFTLTDYSGTNYTNDSQNVQQAQGYMHLEAPATSTDGTGAIGVWLDTNRPDLVTTTMLWPRFDPEDAAYNGPAHINTVNHDPSMFFCKPGLPKGAKLAVGSFGTADDKTVAAADINDTACDGYTLAWAWTKTSTSYQVVDACSTHLQTPLPTAFPAPTVNALSASDQTKALSWGDYTSYGPNPLYDGNPTTFKALLREAGLSTVPYDGGRPGRGSGYIQGACSKSYSDGRYNGGSWSSAGTHVETSQVANPTSTTTQNPDCTFAKDGSYSCPSGELPYIEHTSYPAYTWSWGSKCLPSNAQAQSITQPQLPIRTASDQQSSYDSQTSGLPGDAWLTNFSDFKRNVGEPDFGSFGRCTGTYSGFVQTGSWTIGRTAGLGFGNNQTGYRLPSDDYLTQFTFGNLSPSALQAGVHWSMFGDYDGFSGWIWKSKQRKASLSDDPSDPGPAVVRVYGTRGSR